MKYTQDICAASLDVLSRAVLVPMHPNNTVARVRQIAKAVAAA